MIRDDINNIEDLNLNGLWEKKKGETCGYKYDSDDDKLWDGYNVTFKGEEHWGELTLSKDPIKKDTDEDDLSDGDEVKTHHTNPLSNDTDMDGLTDSQELYETIKYNSYYYGMDGAWHNDSISISPGTLSAVNPDSDGDGLTDGQEINGWKVMLAWQEEGEEEMTMRERIYKTNASVDQRSILDSDQDGISDKTEIEISKLCDYSRDVNGWKGASSYHSTLYNTYKWFIENRVEKASDWQEWNETIQSQFNPYMKENIPPIVSKFKSDFEYDTTWYGVTFGSVSIGLNIIESIWIKTTISVFDAGKISSLRIELATSISIPTISWSGISYEKITTTIGTKTYTNIAAGIHTFVFEKSIDGLTWAVGQAIGFDASIKVIDTVGKTTAITLHRDGLFDKVWDFLSEIWAKIVGAITAAVKAVIEVLGWIWEWILEQAMKIFSPALNLVKGAIKGFINSMTQAINDAFEIVSESAGDAAELLANAVFSGYFFYTLLGLCVALQTISTVISAYTLGMIGVAGKLITTVLVPEIMKAIFKTIITGAISLAGIAAIAGILYTIKPEGDPFWKEGLGLHIFGIATVFAKTRAWKSVATGDILNVKKEIFGFILAIVGILTYIWLGDVIVGLMAAWTSLMLAGIGALIVWLNKDVFDLNPLSPLSQIEEIFSMVAVGYSIVQVGSYYA